MKTLLLAFSFLIIPQWVMANWVDDLVLEIETRGVEIENQGDLIRYLQQSNEESNALFSRTDSGPYEDTKATRDLLQILETHDGKKVQINYFKRAYFYGESKRNKRGLSSVDRIANGRTSIKKKIKKTNSFQFDSHFFYSRIEAIDSQNGGNFHLSSKLNMGLDASYRRGLNRKMNLLFNVGGSFIGFNPPASINLQGESGLYLNGASTLMWQLDSIFLAKATIGMKQLPYITAFGGQLEVDQALQPYFGAGLELNLKKGIKLDLRPELRATVLNNSIKSDVTADSGFQLGALVHYYFKYKEYRPRLSLWYNSYSQQTTKTEQSMSEVGLNIGFELPL